MNDKLQHVLITVAITAIGALAGFPEIGAAAAIAGFFGREHAAAVWNLRYNEGWMDKPHWRCDLEAFKIWEWRKDNLLDFVVTIPAAIGSFLVFNSIL